MLPDDDKRYAIKTCRSSESVLKKWFKVNDIQLVHCLVVWYLVNKALCLFSPLNAELNPICHLLSLLGAHHILYVSIRVNTFKPEVSSDKICKFDSYETRYFVFITKTNLLFFVQDNTSRLFWSACETSKHPFRKNALLCRIAINPFKTKRRLLYLKTQSVPRCKHFSSRL